MIFMKFIFFDGFLMIMCMIFYFTNMDEYLTYIEKNFR